jgi:hypothetical protein
MPLAAWSRRDRCDARRRDCCGKVTRSFCSQRGRCCECHGLCSNAGASTRRHNSVGASGAYPEQGRPVCRGPCGNRPRSGANISMSGVRCGRCVESRKRSSILPAYRNGYRRTLATPTRMVAYGQPPFGFGFRSVGCHGFDAAGRCQARTERCDNALVGCRSPLQSARRQCAGADRARPDPATPAWALWRRGVACVVGS